jgi:hypothetical protein
MSSSPETLARARTRIQTQNKEHKALPFLKSMYTSCPAPVNIFFGVLKGVRGVWYISEKRPVRGEKEWRE